jgi:hypothetical protein
MDRTEATKSREVANSAVNVGAGLALLADDGQTGSNRITIISWLNFPGVGTGEQNAVTLIHFASSAEIFEISASLIR